MHPGLFCSYRFFLRFASALFVLSEVQVLKYEELGRADARQMEAIRELVLPRERDAEGLLGCILGVVDPLRRAARRGKCAHTVVAHYDGASTNDKMFRILCAMLRADRNLLLLPSVCILHDLALSVEAGLNSPVESFPYAKLYRVRNVLTAIEVTQEKLALWVRRKLVLQRAGMSADAVERGKQSWAAFYAV